MRYIILLALLTLTFTCILTGMFFPDYDAHYVVWGAVGFLILAQVVLYSALAAAIMRRYAGEQLQVGVLAAAGMYALFSLVMVPVAPLLNGYKWLLLPHFLAIVVLAGLVAGVRGVHSRNEQHVSTPPAPPAEVPPLPWRELEEILHRAEGLKDRGFPRETADKLYLLSERLKLCRGAADSASDADLEAKVREIHNLINDAASDPERVNRLPMQLSRPIVDLDVLTARRERLSRICPDSSDFSNIKH